MKTLLARERAAGLLFAAVPGMAQGPPSPTTSLPPEKVESMGQPPLRSRSC